MKLNLTSKWMKGIVTKLIAKAIRKNIGYDVDIQLNNVNLVVIDGKVRIHADLDAEATQDEVKKILKEQLGLD